jgi:hypothetical protein
MFSNSLGSSFSISATLQHNPDYITTGKQSRFLNSSSNTRITLSMFFNSLGSSFSISSTLQFNSDYSILGKQSGFFNLSLERGFKT